MGFEPVMAGVAQRDEVENIGGPEGPTDKCDGLRPVRARFGPVFVLHHPVRSGVPFGPTAYPPPVVAREVWFELQSILTAAYRRTSPTVIRAGQTKVSDAAAYQRLRRPADRGGPRVADGWMVDRCVMKAGGLRFRLRGSDILKESKCVDPAYC